MLKFNHDKLLESMNNLAKRHVSAGVGDLTMRFMDEMQFLLKFTSDIDDDESTEFVKDAMSMCTYMPDVFTSRAGLKRLSDLYVFLSKLQVKGRLSGVQLLTETIIKGVTWRHVKIDEELPEYAMDILKSRADLLELIANPKSTDYCLVAYDIPMVQRVVKFLRTITKTGDECNAAECIAALDAVVGMTEDEPAFQLLLPNLNVTW